MLKHVADSLYKIQKELIFENTQGTLEYTTDLNLQLINIVPVFQIPGIYKETQQFLNAIFSKYDTDIEVLNTLFLTHIGVSRHCSFKMHFPYSMLFLNTLSYISAEHYCLTSTTPVSEIHLAKRFCMIGANCCKIMATCKERVKHLRDINRAQGKQ